MGWFRKLGRLLQHGSTVDKRARRARNEAVKVASAERARLQSVQNEIFRHGAAAARGDVSGLRGFAAPQIQAAGSALDRLRDKMQEQMLAAGASPEYIARRTTESLIPGEIQKGLIPHMLGEKRIQQAMDKTPAGATAALGQQIAGMRGQRSTPTESFGGNLGGILAPLGMLAGMPMLTAAGIGMSGGSMGGMNFGGGGRGGGGKG